MTVNKYTQSCGSSVSPNLEPNISKLNEDCSHLGVLDTGVEGESTAEDPTSCNPSMRVDAVGDSNEFIRERQWRHEPSV